MNEVRIFLSHDSLEQRAWRGIIDRPRWRDVADVLAEIAQVDAERTGNLVLAGAGVERHPAAGEILAAAAALGTDVLTLEFEAAMFDSASAAALPVGTKAQRWMVWLSPGPSGGFEDRTWEGTEAVVRSAGLVGASVYWIVPLVRATRDAVKEVADRAIAVRSGIQGVLLSLPEPARVAPQLFGELLPYKEQAGAAAQLFRVCQGYGLEYGFTSKRGILPCAAKDELASFATVFFDRADFMRHTARVTEESFVEAPVCAECSLRETCFHVEKPYAEFFGFEGLEAVPLAVSMGWKLRRINRLEKNEYRNVSPFQNDSLAEPRGLLRINGHCNMSCAFCFVDRTVDDFAFEAMRSDIQRMATQGTRHLVLSGGEPTLHPDLANLIRVAAATRAFDTIEIQSNGVKCADEAYVRELCDAGLTKATISLHSADAGRSDEITRLPGAFAKTIDGIHNLRRAGVQTQIAHVITKANYQELPDTVRFLRETFPASGGYLSICFGIAQGISDLVFQWVIPRFDEIRPSVRAALDYCLENDIGFGGLIGQGGYPPCMLDGELRYYGRVLDKVFRSSDSDSQFFKPERCRECSFDPYCLGPRRSYVEQYGDAEIQPVVAAVPDARTRADERHSATAGAP